MSSKKIAVLLVVALALSALSLMTACTAAQPQTIIETVVGKKKSKKL
jgi:hypothetical protein